MGKPKGKAKHGPAKGSERVVSKNTTSNNTTTKHDINSILDKVRLLIIGQINLHQKKSEFNPK